MQFRFDTFFSSEVLSYQTATTPFYKNYNCTCIITTHCIYIRYAACFSTSLIYTIILLFNIVFLWLFINFVVI